MANPTIANDGSVDAAKFHVYITENTGTPNGWTDSKAVIDPLLTAAVHFKKVETGMTLSEEAGDSITSTTGVITKITKNFASTFNAYGLSPSDYQELVSGTNNLQDKDVDLAIVKAPADRADGTVVIGDEIVVVERVPINMILQIVDGQPIKLACSLEQIAASGDYIIKWDTVVA